METLIWSWKGDRFWWDLPSISFGTLSNFRIFNMVWPMICFFLMFALLFDDSRWLWDQICWDVVAIHCGKSGNTATSRKGWPLALWHLLPPKIYQDSTMEVKTRTGWWFGTFYFFPYIGNNKPNWLRNVFWRVGEKPPSRRIISRICPGYVGRFMG